VCEFKVLLTPNRAEVARDIVNAYYENGNLILIDILGAKTSLDNTIIETISVDKEELVVMKNPLIGPVLNFIRRYIECMHNKKYDRDLDLLWNYIKKRGDELLNDLRNVCQK